MTADPYMEAIQAGAAALAKPYRDPDTVEAFVEAFPTIAAARVIEAALPLLRATILTEQAAPGPCPAVTEFGHEGIFANDNDTPRQLRALCDLRAGHTGQHEASHDDWGNFRWSDPADAEERPYACESEYWLGPLLAVSVMRCERTRLHVGYHINGVHVWDDQLNQLLPHTDETAAPKFLPYTCGLKTMRGSIRGVDGGWINCERLPDHTGWHTKGQIRWNDCGEVVDPYAR